MEPLERRGSISRSESFSDDYEPSVSRTDLEFFDEVSLSDPTTEATLGRNVKQVAEGGTGGKIATMTALTLSTLHEPTQKFELLPGHVPGQDLDARGHIVSGSTPPSKSPMRTMPTKIDTANADTELNKPLSKGEKAIGALCLVFFVPAVLVYIGLVAGTGILTALGSALDLNDMDKHPKLFAIGFLLKSIPNLPAQISEDIIVGALTLFRGREQGENSNEKLTGIRQICMYGVKYAKEEHNERQGLPRRPEDTPSSSPSTASLGEQARLALKTDNLQAVHIPEPSQGTPLEKLQRNQEELNNQSKGKGKTPP